ncbi:hypothetical protein TA3x_000531 [Tundrisphaera sp. TA3]|uniref:hypothetical protein n=1 Tax=Tundrisphaera sp. TA3 TaxID=3435775 RepID=UPI003EB85E5B
MFALHTYEKLRDYCRHFADGTWPCLIVVGSGGLGKSRTMAEALPKINTSDDAGARWIESHVSAFQLYRELHAHKDRTFVLDDVDHLCRDQMIVKLLKNLCNTEETRRIYWATSNRDLERENVPREFDTKSKIALIINRWDTVDENVGALEDRGMVVRFAPPSVEVHRQVGSWFRDKRVYDYIGDRLDRIFKPSQRLYLGASAMRERGLGDDWKAWVEEKIALPDELQIVRDLRADKSYTSEDRRVQRYLALTGKSRASYFRVVADLKALEAANSVVAARPKMPPRKRAAQPSEQAVELKMRKAAKAAPKPSASKSKTEGADGTTGGVRRGRPKKAKAGDDFRGVAEVLPLVEASGGEQGQEIITLSMTSRETALDSGGSDTGIEASLSMAS